ncbi:hypothetical protein tpqmel_1073, partial [Candidatus Gastranaerophilus sp. (ex Termes propinquus)]
MISQVNMNMAAQSAAQIRMEKYLSEYQPERAAYSS